ncbi:MAG: hypothetical protein JSV77_03630 [Dehalococcoidales bacterium]|nr:MAG: hypothetical protein JSV77_03630 [Dehalococcoidales bacterium]
MGKKEEIADLFNKQDKSKMKVITEDDLKGLPEPAQRYFRYSGVIGMAPVKTVSLKQKGFFRMKEGQKMMPMQAEQYYTTNPPSFIWYGEITPIPLISIKARDMFVNGKGSMLIKLLGLFKVGENCGIEMAQAALTRYLSETIWFPTALLDESVSWTPVDTNSAKVIIEYAGIKASGLFYFDSKGQLKNFTTERYQVEGNALILRPWSTPIEAYKEINNLNIPYRGDAVWHLDGREFKYIEVEITELKYTL